VKNEHREMWQQHVDKNLYTELCKDFTAIQIVTEGYHFIEVNYRSVES